MMPSLFYTFLLLAAGSKASPCKLHSGNWTSSSTTGAKAALHRDGHGSVAVNLNLPLQYSQESALPSSTSADVAAPSVAPSDSSGSSGGSSGSGSSAVGGSGTSDTSASLTPASGSCPPGFINAVFNTNAGQSSGFPSATWNSLKQYGIEDWSTLALAAPENMNI